MVLNTNTNKELQYMFYEYINYFEFIGLQIFYNDRDKSVYTNNTSKYEKIYIDKKDTNNLIIRKYLLYYNETEFYKYLGIWINLILN